MTSRVLLCALTAAAVVVAMALPADAEVIAPATVRNFGVYIDNGDRQFDAHLDTKAACVTNMLQWLSAGTSYGYKQYDNQPGADLSAWPNSSDGLMSGASHQTWLQPEKDTLQFWLGWSRLDHDPGTVANVNPDFAAAARGYNLGIVMNQEDKYWDNDLGQVIHKPTEGVVRNTVRLDISVKGSSMTPISGESTDPYNIAPRVVLSDDHSSDPDNFWTVGSHDELPRPPAPTAGSPYPTLTGQELYQDGLVEAGWDQHFYGNWTYNEDSTDGGVLGNLRPDAAAPLGTFVIRIGFEQLRDALGPTDPNDPNYKGIKKIVFYSFNDTGEYDPYDPASYAQAGFTRYEFDVSELGEGSTIFITDCCTHAPEPMSLALLAAGGLGLGGYTLRRRRQAQ